MTSIPTNNSNNNSNCWRRKSSSSSIATKGHTYKSPTAVSIYYTAYYYSLLVLSVTLFVLSVGLLSGVIVVSGLPIITINQDDATTTTTAATASSTSNQHHHNHLNPLSMFEQMWHNVQEQFHMIQKNINNNHHHQQQHHQQQISMGSMFENELSNLLFQQNNLQARFLPIQQHQQQRQAAAAAKQQQQQQQQQQQYDAGGAGVTAHPIGPGQATYNRRRSLYQHSLNLHYKDVTTINASKTLRDVYWTYTNHDTFRSSTTPASSNTKIYPTSTATSSSKPRKNKEQQTQRALVGGMSSNRSYRNKNNVESRSSTLHSSLPPFPNSFKKSNKKMIREMFQYSYDAYMYHGYPAAEVRPLSCTGAEFDLVKLQGLTLIDSLDSLLVITNNVTEFARSVERLRLLDTNDPTGLTSLFRVDQNVSVFETTIRVLGGLLSAHLLAEAYELHILHPTESSTTTTTTTTTTERSNGNNKVLWSQVFDTNKNVKWGGLDNDDDDDERTDTAEPTTQCTTATEEATVDSSNTTTNSCTTPECATNDSTYVLNNDDIKVTESTTTTTTTTTVPSEPRYWVYDGYLLQLAEDIGSRLLPALEVTKTGIPYGTINLLYGVPQGETTVASVAGGGTLVLEFELLSRLTGDTRYGRAAKLATRALWMRRSKSPLNLMGKHIDIQEGYWTETLSGIGSNSDSFLEYLAKQYMLFPEDTDFWIMLQTAYQGVSDHSRVGEWYVDTDMSTGSQSGSSRRVFESLAAFYPGLQVLLGELPPAGRTLNSMFMVRELLGFLPERFNFGIWNLDGMRDGAGKHPLRPELLESAYFMHRSTRNLLNRGRTTTSAESNASNLDEIMAASSGWQWAADFALHKLNHTAYAKCGYAGIQKMSPVHTGLVDDTLDSHRQQQQEWKSMGGLMDEMPSFFLSETLKYLFLIFDDDEESIIHSDIDREWIFTTEAHPFHYVPKKSREKKIGFRETKVVPYENEIARIKEMLAYKLEGIEKSDSADSIHNDNWRRRRRPLTTKSASRPSYENLRDEKWTEISNHRTYREGIDKSNSHIISTRRRTVKNKNKHTASELIPIYTNEPANDDDESNDFTQRSLLLTPFVSSKQIHDIFRETDSRTNDAQLAFENLSLGTDLRMSCPNLYSSKLLWSQAMNGGSVDYTDIFVSVTSDSLSDHPNSFIILGAAEALGTLGSGLYFGEMDDMDGQSCPIVDPNTGKIRTSELTVTNIPSNAVAAAATAIEQPKDEISDVVNVDSDIGRFELASYHDGSGFIIHNKDSNEKITVSFLRDDKNKNFDYALVATELRSSTDQNGSKIKSAEGDDERKEFPIVRHLNVADFDGNTFSCRIEIIEKSIFYNDKENGSESVSILKTVPCAPAMFGPSHMTVLMSSTDGLIVESTPIIPAENDPTGCNGKTLKRRMEVGTSAPPTPFIDTTAEIPMQIDNTESDLSENVENEKHIADEQIETTREPANGIRLAYRGACTFHEKSINSLELHNAKALIVINDKDHDMFLMANAGEDVEAKSKYSEHELPVTVLISNEDGEAILDLLRDGTNRVVKSDVLQILFQESTITSRVYIKRQVSQINERTGKVSSEGDDDVSANRVWPFVQGNERVLQIVAENGWGIQAYQRPIPENPLAFDWQIQLLRHSTTLQG